MLYADPLPKAAAGLRVQLFCYSLSPLFLSLSLLSFLCVLFCFFHPRPAEWIITRGQQINRQNNDQDKIKDKLNEEPP